MKRVTSEGFVLVELKVADNSVTRVFVSTDATALDMLKAALESENDGYFTYAFREAIPTLVPVPLDSRVLDGVA